MGSAPFYHTPCYAMNTRSLFSVLLILACSGLSARADEFDAQSFLGMSAGNSVGAAIKRGEKDGKKVLVYAYDAKAPNQAFHIKGMLQLEETRKLVRENFLIVVTDFKDKNIREHVGSESQTRPMFFLFGPDGKLIQKGTAAVGPAVGGKMVKDWTATK